MELNFKSHNKHVKISQKSFFITFHDLQPNDSQFRRHSSQPIKF